MREKGSLGDGVILRPLLSYSKNDLEQYAKREELQWIEDDSNHNVYFARNFLRHRIIPTLEEKWPHTIRALAKTASHCQQAKVNLQHLACIDYPLPLTEPVLDLTLVPNEPARLSNLLLEWLSCHQVGFVSSSTIDKIYSIIHAREDATASLNINKLSCDAIKVNCI